jgi:hypothetical protein
MPARQRDLPGGTSDACARFWLDWCMCTERAYFSRLFEQQSPDACAGEYRAQANTLAMGE